MTRRPPVLLFTWLVALWIVLWRELSVGNVVGGVLVAIGVLSLSRTPRTADEPGVIRPVAALRFAGSFVWQLVRANLLIAFEVVRRDQTRRSGIVSITMRDCTDRLITLEANALTLTPGSITVDVHGDPMVIYVHLLRVDDVEQARSELEHLSALAVEAFGNATALAAIRGQLAEATADDSADNSGGERG